MVKIRSAQPRDISRLVEIENECFGEGLRLCETTFSDAMDNPLGMTLRVAVVDGLTVGYVLAQHGRPMSDFDTEKRGQEINIVSMAVDPAFRGQGISKELIARLEVAAAAKFENGAVITAEVLPGNEGSRKVFVGCDFEQAATKKGFYGPGQDALYFEKIVATSSTPRPGP